MSEEANTEWMLQKAPLFPEKARKIIRMRLSGMLLKDIGAQFGMTPAGVLHYVVRWSKWYKETAE
jgi:hypothetical protein